jgi:hypothetical protein
MADRLLVGVLGNRNAGKSRTWNSLFGKTVRRGKSPHHLVLRPGECVEAFLVSASFEEQRKYAGDILDSVDCRIVLCSIRAENFAEAPANCGQMGAISGDLVPLERFELPTLALRKPCSTPELQRRLEARAP